MALKRVTDSDLKRQCCFTSSESQPHQQLFAKLKFLRCSVKLKTSVCKPICVSIDGYKGLLGLIWSQFNAGGATDQSKHR